MSSDPEYIYLYKQETMSIKDSDGNSTNIEGIGMAEVSSGQRMRLGARLVTFRQALTPGASSRYVKQLINLQSLSAPMVGNGQLLHRTYFSMRHEISPPRLRFKYASSILKRGHNWDFKAGTMDFSSMACNLRASSEFSVESPMDAIPTPPKRKGGRKPVRQAQ